MRNRSIILNFLNPEFLFRASLCAAWLLGTVLGFYFSFADPAAIASLMRGLFLEPVSIVGLVACIGIPFTVWILCLYFSAPYFLIAIAFLKSFLSGICLAALQLAFGDAAWLARWLLMFSEACVSPLFLWCWLYSGTADLRQNRTILLFLGLAIVICIVDYSVIYPFALSLFSY